MMLYGPPAAREARYRCAIASDLYEYALMAQQTGQLGSWKTTSALALRAWRVLKHSVPGSRRPHGCEECGALLDDLP